MSTLRNGYQGVLKIPVYTLVSSLRSSQDLSPTILVSCTQSQAISRTMQPGEEKLYPSNSTNEDNVPGLHPSDFAVFYNSTMPGSCVSHTATVCYSESEAFKEVVDKAIRSDMTVLQLQNMPEFVEHCDRMVRMARRILFKIFKMHGIIPKAEIYPPITSDQPTSLPTPPMVADFEVLWIKGIYPKANFKSGRLLSAEGILSVPKYVATSAVVRYNTEHPQKLYFQLTDGGGLRVVRHRSDELFSPMTPNWPPLAIGKRALGSSHDLPKWMRPKASFDVAAIFVPPEETPTRMLF